MRPLLRSVLVAALLASGTAFAQTSPNPQALASYEQGKRLYDAKSFTAALERFDQAAAIEPGNPRWQYNRGLALRKLGRTAEARAALLEARRLDPKYKAAEIDQKLADLGGSTAEPPTQAPVQDQNQQEQGQNPDQGEAPQVPEEKPFFPNGDNVTGVLLIVGFVGLVATIIFLTIRLSKWMERRFQEQVRAQQAQVQAHLDDVEQQVQAQGPRLAAVERAFRAGEDPEARAQVDRSMRAAEKVRKLIPRAKAAEGKKQTKRLAELDAAAFEMTQAVSQAEEQVQSRFGPEALHGQAERVGCWFCARPLPNPAGRVTLSVKQGAETFPAVVCPDCAARVEAGDPPRVKVVEQGGRQVHWSEVPEFDPYLAQHQPFPGAATVGLHRLTPEPGRSLGQMALLAAGGALAVGAGAALASHLVDFDALRTSAAASAAARASAERPSQRDRLRDQS